MKEMILQTKRMNLRYQEESDTDFILSLWTDEECTKHTGGPRDRAFLLEEITKVTKNPKREEYDLWPIEEKETLERIGQAGFIPKEIEGQLYIELNYYIKKEHWGKGYATEIAAKLLEYAFKEKRLNEVIAIINPRNKASEKVAEKIGMAYWKTMTRSHTEKKIYMIRKEET